jgi:hypothetical protein
MEDIVFVELWPGLDDYRIMYNACDKIVFDRNEITYALFNGSRTGRVIDENKSIYKKNFPPLELEEIRHIRKIIENRLEKIKLLTEYFYPLICEFHIDFQDSLAIMEIRNEFYLKNWMRPIKYFLQTKKVSTVSDIKKLKKGDNVILDISLSREETRECFYEIINALKKVGISTVYVKFGLLSHPAILLREHGIRPIPIFKNYKIYKEDR